jgi:PAS domain S-box-containing protein
VTARRREFAGDRHDDGAKLEEAALDLYENAPCSYLSTDPHGLIIRVNQTFLDWTGHRRDELVGVKRFQDLLTAGGRIYHETHYAPLLRMQGSVREIAVDIIGADGRRLPALVNAVLKRDAHDEPLLVRTTIFDATDRKRYERELVAARDRERIARERTERLQRLTEALAAALDAGAIARAVTEVLVAILGADRAGFAIDDGSRNGLRVIFRHGAADGAPATDVGRGAIFDEGDLPGRGARALLPIGASHCRGLLWLKFDAARPFTPEERALVIACAGQTTLALERARLYEEQRDVAHVLQRSMLAGAPPDDSRFEVAALYKPAGDNLEVGGDWYDTFTVPGGRVCIVVGDVVGRGLTAASAMGQLRSAVRALAGARLGPAQVLTHLDTFVDQIPAAQYATLAYAEVEPDTGQTYFASAGHLPPVLLAESDAPRLFMAGRSPPLGISIPGGIRAQAELRLRPNTGFLLYTDGLVERRGESIDAGLDRLTSAVTTRGVYRPCDLVDHLSAVLLPNEGSDDDVCLLCFIRR